MISVNNESFQMVAFIDSPCIFNVFKNIPNININKYFISDLKYRICIIYVSHKVIYINTYIYPHILLLSRAIKSFMITVPD